MKIWKEPFGVTKDGTEVSKYFLENRNGTQAVVTDFGVTLLSLCFAGRDVVLGYDNIRDYEQQVEYLGATVGRFAGTIANGDLRIENQQYALSRNIDGHSIHGGFNSFSFRVWEARILPDSICFSLVSADGEEGFPGNLRVTTTIRLTPDDGLEILYDAVCDRDTVLNMTSHAYFNLEGHASGSALEHILQSPAQYYREESAEGIPLAELFAVEGTPFDFRQPHPFGRDLNMPHPQLDPHYGFDRNGYLGEAGIWKRAALVEAPVSGITMEVLTTQTGMQLYCPGYLLEGHPAKKVGVYKAYGGFCIEAQHCLSPAEAEQGILYPVLPANTPYHHETIYQFKRRNGYEE